VSSSTRRSFWDLSMYSPPRNDIGPAHRRTRREGGFPRAASAGFLGKVSDLSLPAVSGDGRLLCGNCCLLLLELADDVTGLRRVDVDARAHRGRERDLADVLSLRGCRLRADNLLDHHGVVLEQLL